MNMNERIRESWTPEDTASTLGAKLGVTRNAISGYYTRDPSLGDDCPLAGKREPANDNAQRPATFDALILQWMAFLRQMAFRVERNAQDREDLVNETIATALQRWASYRAEGSFAGWLAFQMRERAQSMRKQRSVRAVSYDAARPSQYDDDGNGRNAPKIIGVEPARQDTVVELAQVTGAMRPGRSGNILMRVASGEEPNEIAPDYGISRERVRQIAVAERERLRRVLNTLRVAA